ncbi:MAG TPA: hypothetical protein PKC39_02980 [Ferruginibacter sp.]|nr:hypothetical protein [Ferruginibacter sp.]HMP19902.1 hypothetical protein [Ferruginibacter sp.]
MAHFYSAYSKLIHGQVFYFVKKFQSYPDLKDVPPVLEGFGMHNDFNKACTIAGITDTKVKEQILKDFNNELPQAKIIEIGNQSLSDIKIAK